MSKGDGTYDSKQCGENSVRSPTEEELRNGYLNSASDGLKDQVVYYLQEGVDVNSKYELGGFTALMMAAMNGHSDIVELLISQGADVNARDKKENKSALELSDNRKIRKLLGSINKTINAADR